ncbi:kelch-like protein 10 [Uloborus diversus]|uniref:kelch-like protein 10 n=1 Tax=Uloborus diversus TaxID=327109 RepID=UPI0024092AA7|nr:kelch-like protein 10 [Uloborus diversus]
MVKFETVRKHTRLFLTPLEHVYKLEYFQNKDLLSEEILKNKNGEKNLVLACKRAVSNDKPWWNAMKNMTFLVIPELLAASHQAYNSLIQATSDSDLKTQMYHKNLSLVQNGVQTLSFQVEKDGSLSFVKKCTPGEYIKPLQPGLDSKMFAVLGWSGDAATSTIEVYDSKSRKWSYFAHNAPLPRAYHGVVVLSGLIYIIGGFDGRYCYTNTYCFNIKTRKWSRKESMHKSRCYVTAVAHCGLIYAMGGHDGIYRFKSCEKYNPKLRKWQFFANMHHRRSDASSAVHKGLIFICGGFDGDIVLDSSEIYDPNSDQWSLIAPMLSPRSGLTLVSYNGRILALGGYDGYDRLSTVEEFDETENCWTSFSPMLTTRSNFAATVFEGEVYAIGGYNGRYTSPDVEKLDENNKWIKVASLNKHRSALGACVLHDSSGISLCSIKGKIEFCTTLRKNI